MSENIVYMKKLLIVLLASSSMVLFSCQESTESATEKKTEETTQDNAAPNVSTQKVDTSRTTISIGKDGGGFENKKGTGVAVDKNGVKVKTKDLKIDIKN